MDQNSSRAKYQAIFKELPSEKPKDIFKRQISFVIEPSNVSFEIVATDCVSLIGGELAKQIFKFKKSHEWTLNQNIVSIIIRNLDMPDKFAKVFCIDIAAFLNFFSDINGLKSLLENWARSLAESWNDVNSAAERVETRTSNEKAMLIDHRKLQWTRAPETYLIFSGTTFNFTLKKQSINTDVYCTKHDISFKLQYKVNDTRRRGGFQLSFTEFFDLLQCNKFLTFVDELWSLFPLTSEYSQRLQIQFKKHNNYPEITFKDALTEDTVLEEEELFVDEGDLVQKKKSKKNHE